MMESFALIDDRKEISLNGMLSFFQRIPAYREEVEKTVRKCKYIGKHLGIYNIFFVLFYYFNLHII